MPWDVAFSLPLTEIMAMLIIFGQLDGLEFDWSTMEWKSPK